MQTKSIGYWSVTIPVALETLAGGVTDLAEGRSMLVAGPRVRDIIARLGYPSYFLKILGVWKVLGGVTLLVPGFPRLKEWAYAGIFFELTGAAASWVLRGDDVREISAPLALTALTVVSWALRPNNRTL